MVSPDDLKVCVISPGGLDRSESRYPDKTRFHSFHPLASTNKLSTYCVPGTVPSPRRAECGAPAQLGRQT